MATSILQGLGSFGSDIGAGAQGLADTRSRLATEELGRMVDRIRVQQMQQQIEETKRQMERETPGGARQYAEQILHRPLTDAEAQIIAKVSPYYYSRSSALQTIYKYPHVDTDGDMAALNVVTGKMEKIPSEVANELANAPGMPQMMGMPPAAGTPPAAGVGAGAGAPGAVPSTTAPAGGGIKFPTKQPPAGPMLQQIIWNQIGKPPDPKAFPGGESDPRYVASRIAWGKTAEKMMKDISSSAAYARGMAYQMYKTVEAIDPDTATVSLNWAKDVVGKGMAPGRLGTQLMGRMQAVNEMKSGSASLRQALTDLQPGDAFDLPSTVVLYSIVHAPMLGMASAIAQNYANGLTNPRQQHLVVALGQMQERALLIRQLGIGGASAVDIRNRIASTVPDVTSGNTELALQKLNAIDNLINYLSGGIPKVNVKAPGFNPPPGRPIWESPTGAAPSAPQDQGGVPGEEEVK